MSDKKTLIEQFDTLDSDSSGQIDVAELFKFLSVKDQEAVKNILLSMDRDVDGQISLEEYIAWCTPSNPNE